MIKVPSNKKTTLLKFPKKLEKTWIFQHLWKSQNRMPITQDLDRRLVAERKNSHLRSEIPNMVMGAEC